MTHAPTAVHAHDPPMCTVIVGGDHHHAVVCETIVFRWRPAARHASAAGCRPHGLGSVAIECWTGTLVYPGWPASSHGDAPSTRRPTRRWRRRHCHGTAVRGSLKRIALATDGSIARTAGTCASLRTHRVQRRVTLDLARSRVRSRLADATGTMTHGDTDADAAKLPCDRCALPCLCPARPQLRSSRLHSPRAHTQPSQSNALSVRAARAHCTPLRPPHIVCSDCRAAAAATPSQPTARRPVPDGVRHGTAGCRSLSGAGHPVRGVSYQLDRSRIQIGNAASERLVVPVQLDRAVRLRPHAEGRNGRPLAARVRR